MGIGLDYSFDELVQGDGVGIKGGATNILKVGGSMRWKVEGSIQ